MVILTQAIQSTGSGGSGTVEFLRIPPLVQKLFNFEVNRVSLSHLPIGSLFVVGEPSLVGCKYFQKNLIYGPGAGVMAQLTPQVMFIHLKTPLGAFGTLKYP